MKRRKVSGRNNNVTSGESAETNNIFDASLIIALLSALGYFIAYSYKKGYRDYYKINEVFLDEINLSHVLISISVSASVLFPIYALYKNIGGLLPDSKNPVWQTFKDKIFIALIGFGGMLTLFPKFYMFKFLSISLLIWIFFIYAFPLLSQWGVKGYLNKLQKQIELEAENRLTSRRIVDLWSASFFTKALLIFGLFMFSHYIANMVGISQAEKKEEYVLIENKNKTFLVIDNSRDNFIIAPVDLKKKQIETDFQVVEAKSELDESVTFKTVIIDGGVDVKEPKEF